MKIQLIKNGDLNHSEYRLTSKFVKISPIFKSFDTDILAEKHITNLLCKKCKHWLFITSNFKATIMSTFDSYNTNYIT